MMTNLTRAATRFLLMLAGACTALCAPLLAHAQDAAAGQKKAAMCIGCHGIVGYQASFPVVYKVPMIAGQNSQYLISALAAYKNGERKHPTMRAIAGSLTDTDMADLAAYYATLGASMIKPVADTPAAAPSTEVAALLTKGACTSCHGANFSKPIAPGYPKLAGQHGDYLYQALKSYATSGNPNYGRGNAIMGGQVKQFKLEELKLLAGYISSLPGEIRTVPESRFR
jgi:cytochrome c553